MSDYKQCSDSAQKGPGLGATYTPKVEVAPSPSPSTSPGGSGGTSQGTSRGPQGTGK